MGREQVRIGALSVGFLVLIVGGMWRSWFVMDMMGTRLGIGLRSVEACALGGPCISVSMSDIRGFYPTLAGVTFWGTLAFALLVVFQAGTRLVRGFASPSLSRRGYLPGAGLFALAFAAAYLFGPDVGPVDTGLVSITVERTFSPLMLLAGLVVGMSILRLAAADDGEVAAYPPMTLPVARATVAPAAPEAVPSATAPSPEPATAPSATASPPSEPDATRACPDELRGRLAFAVTSGELSRAGIDAHAETGPRQLLLWRDVVGLVARRLPDTYLGATFIDLLAGTGEVLRVLPWTKLTGERLVDDAEPTGATRARAFAALVRTHVEAVRMDAGTREFVEGSAVAPQIPTVEALATHDQRIAQLAKPSPPT